MSGPDPREPRPSAGATRTAEIEGVRLTYEACRVLPDSVMLVREILREAERLWVERLGEGTYRRLSSSAAGRRFFSGTVRVETVPPAREVVVVRLPFPQGTLRRIKPQLTDYVEPEEGPDQTAVS